MGPQAVPQGAPALLDAEVRLVPPRRDHVQMLVELGQDAECLRWGDASPTGSPGAAESWVAVALERWADPHPWTPRQWVVEVHDGGVWRSAGTVEYRPDGHGAVEVGYAVHPASRGRGLAVRAVRLALDHGFRDDGVHTARWRAEVGNWASRRVAWRLGFSPPQRVRGLMPGHGTEQVPRDGWISSLRHDEAREAAYPWLVVPTLHGADVVLRPWRHEDAPRVVEACTDPLTRRYLPALPSPYGMGEAMVFVDTVRDAAARGTEVSWCAADPSTDRCLGAVSLMGLTPESGQGEVGYWLHPEARGRGAMRAAVRTAVGHGFSPATDGGLGLRRVLLRTAGSNVASQRVALALGMTEVGRDRLAETLGDGTVEDMVRFDLLEDEPS
ncbi:GNAT family N-acetyltransferase [Ornithinimicrobium cerasi]|uniref:Protein N-acetyltransferase, RimJ/RimL family n=1 Tax=Ornithinimicrobium cerasi TaxID=2248773 RepID=A0A285VET2_9MICO|nr:GNAT family N-acetyltransferase [Ornithinimicrobium cerasi]SOC52467.1 Protein N-acetyltransferase, RimJ/RimL family [Ornithinimicrobium cerasi]